MKALPVEKLPIKGSAGAALRRQLLQKQLPLHDIDHKVCDELSEQETKQFEKYLENIKKYVGQGMVTKILSARPFDRSLMTPANATDMQHFSPQRKVNTQQSMVQLRTPSSFTPKISYKKDLHEDLKKYEQSSEMLNESSKVTTASIRGKYNLTGDNVVHSSNFSKTNNCHDIVNEKNPVIEHSKHPNSAVIRSGNSAVTASSSNSSDHYIEAHNDITDKLKRPSFAFPLYSKPANDLEYTTESILADTLVPSGTIHTNDIIGSTLDKQGLMFIREKLTTKYSKQENQGQVPHNVSSLARDLNSSDLVLKNDNTVTQTVDFRGTLNPLKDEIQKADKIVVDSKPIKAEKEVIKSASQIIRSTAFNSLPIRNIDDKEKLKENTLLTPSLLQMHKYPNEAKISSFTTPSTVIYSEKLKNQIFPYETTSTPANQSIQNLHVPKYLEHGIEELTTKDSINSQKCHKCEEEIRVGDVAVVTEKTKNAVWHPGCFVCDTCNELLVDLVYFYYKNKLYCGRDLATLLGIPRCFACDELIFVREYTVAEGHNYHVKHFCCWDCDVPLAGKQYITENDRPLCLSCYQKTYAKTCNTCEKVIAADQQGVALKDLDFHATDVCFCCYICKKSLLHSKIAVKEKKLLCSKECISKFLHG
ncbi:testin LIM domain protein isoform X2 [Calliopsis andreniformis]